jgi:hypothetical protein
VVTTVTTRKRQAKERTAKEARAESFRRWAESLGFRVRLVRLSATQLEELLALRERCGVRHPEVVGFSPGKVDYDALSEAEEGRFRRLMRVADPRRSGRKHDRDSVAFQMGQLLATFLESDEKDAELEGLRELARSSALAGQVAASKLLSDDVADGKLDVLDTGVLVALLHRIAASQNGIATIRNFGSDRFRMPSGHAFNETLDRLTVAGWIDSSPPRVVRSYAKEWQVSLGPLSAAAAEQALRHRELALQARGKA